MFFKHLTTQSILGDKSFLTSRKEKLNHFVFRFICIDIVLRRYIDSLNKRCGLNSQPLPSSRLSTVILHILGACVVSCCVRSRCGSYTIFGASQIAITRDNHVLVEVKPKLILLELRLASTLPNDTSETYLVQGRRPLRPSKASRSCGSDISIHQ